MKLKNISLIGSLAFLLLAVSTIAFAQELSLSAVRSEIADLNSAIQKKGAAWQAAETPISRLSPAELQQRVGTVALKLAAKPIPDEMGAEEDQPPLPSSWNWREHNAVSAVKNQLNCGSCWAFAMTGGLESNALLTHNASGKVSYSEQVLISCGGIGSCKGGTLDADFLVSKGLPPTDYYPYTQSNGDCAKAGANWEKAAYKIGDWGSVTQDLSAIKTALTKYGPLPTAFMVYADFKHYKSGVYSHVSGKKLGGHAVLIVGYNDDDKYFIVKNSWGDDWGENGFFRIAYSEMTNESNFGMSTIAYQAAESQNYYSHFVKNDMSKPAKDMQPLLDQAVLIQ